MKEQRLNENLYSWHPINAKHRKYAKKCKAIPVTCLGSPKNCEMSRLPHVLDNGLTDGGEVVSPTSLPSSRPLLPRRFLVLISIRGWVDPRAIVRLEQFGQLRNPMTSSEMEPATFRLVAQCLNQLRYCVSHIISYRETNKTKSRCR
jgi:hypothetical protein